MRAIPAHYVALHQWVNRNFPRVGRCEYCGRRRKTQYASIGHVYTRNRGDWFELWHRCHKWFDGDAGSLHLRERTHCPQGHPYDETNTLVIPSRPHARYCRICKREHNRAYKARRRAEGRLDRTGRLIKTKPSPARRKETL